MKASRWSARKAHKRLATRVATGALVIKPNLAMNALVTPRAIPLSVLEHKLIALQGVVLGRLRDKSHDSKGIGRC